MLYDGEYFRAKKKKYEEVVFFVPFFDGRKAALARHIEWVNSLGFDAFAFELERRKWLFDSVVTSDVGFGWKHYYADQIEALLNEIPGKKLVFSFSNPTASTIEALSRRRCADVSALVCDSGPSGRLFNSITKLYHRDRHYSWLKSYIVAAADSLLWSPYFHLDLGRELARFPVDFPVLSVRGWKDELISPSDIDAVFEPQSHLDWRKLALPEADHLNGLRDFPKEYKPSVKSFLEAFATPTVS